MTTIVTIDMGGTGATHAAGAREALSVPSMTDMGQSYAQANSARDQANTAYGQANGAYSSANLAYAQANSARSDANTTFATINTTFASTNTIDATQNTWISNLNSAASTINTSLGTINTNYQAAYAQANTARTTANDAYGAANTRLSASGGTLSGDLIITGNLTVSGNQTILNTEVLTTEDADIILLSNTSSTPALNAGLIINRGTSTNTFLRWDEALDEWGWSDSGTTTYYFEDLRQGLSTTNTTFGTINTSLGTINTNYQAAYSQANTAGTNSLNAYGQANTARDTANSAYGQANAAYSQANSAYGAANNRVLKAGDTMTGQLNISSGGLLVTGNVGFGMPSPIFPLQVKTNTGTTPQALQLNTTDWTTTIGSAFQFGFGAATGNTYSEIRALSGGYNAWNNLVLQSGGGNVGIGTTNPVCKLHVAGPGNTTGGNIHMGDNTNGASKWTYLTGAHYNGATNTTGISMIGSYSDSGQNAVVIGGSIYEANPATVIQFWTHTATTHSSGGTERARITSDGNVGIGVTTPQRKLDVFGSGILASFGSGMGVNSIAGIHFGYSESSSNVDTYKKSAMVFERTDSHNQGGNASGKIHFLLHNSGSASASATNSAVLTLDTDSNGTLGSARVGIGTTSPAQTLHVNGNARIDGYITNIRNNGGVSAPSTSDHSLGTRITLYDSTAVAWYAIGIESDTMWFNSDANYKWYVDASQRMILDGSGNLTINGTLTENSSETIKENINPITNALDSVLQLVGVVYDRKDGSAKNRAGLIAEEVEQVLPNVVQKDDNGNPTGIQYTNLIAYLVESIKELKAEIDAIKSK